MDPSDAQPWEVTIIYQDACTLQKAAVDADKANDIALSLANYAQALDKFTMVSRASSNPARARNASAAMHDCRDRIKALNERLEDGGGSAAPSPDPGPSPSPSPSKAPRKTVKVQDALSYLDLVKSRFSGQPQVYNSFLDIMKDFKTTALDTPGVIARVCSLFDRDEELIIGFNTFLPPGHQIEIGEDGGVFAGGVAFDQPALQPTSDQPRAPPNPQPDQPRNPPGSEQTSFDEAIGFVQKIKRLFHDQPGKYKGFLAILHSYQAREMSITEVYSQVSELLSGHKELLVEFHKFLPRRGPDIKIAEPVIEPQAETTTEKDEHLKEEVARLKEQLIILEALLKERDAELKERDAELKVARSKLAFQTTVSQELQERLQESERSPPNGEETAPPPPEELCSSLLSARDEKIKPMLELVTAAHAATIEDERGESRVGREEDETKAPGDETKEAKAPKDEAKAPKDEAKAPKDEAKAPKDEAKAALEGEAKAPKEDIVLSQEELELKIKGADVGDEIYCKFLVSQKMGEMGVLKSEISQFEADGRKHLDEFQAHAQKHCDNRDKSKGFFDWSRGESAVQMVARWKESRENKIKELVVEFQALLDTAEKTPLRLIDQKLKGAEEKLKMKLCPHPTFVSKVLKGRTVASVCEEESEEIKGFVAAHGGENKGAILAFVHKLKTALEKSEAAHAGWPQEILLENTLKFYEECYQQSELNSLLEEASSVGMDGVRSSLCSLIEENKAQLKKRAEDMGLDSSVEDKIKAHRLLWELDSKEGHSELWSRLVEEAFASGAPDKVLSAYFCGPAGPFPDEVKEKYSRLINKVEELVKCAQNLNAGDGENCVPDFVERLVANMRLYRNAKNISETIAPGFSVCVFPPGIEELPEEKASQLSGLLEMERYATIERGPVDNPIEKIEHLREVSIGLNTLNAAENNNERYSEIMSQMESQALSIGDWECRQCFRDKNYGGAKKVCDALEKYAKSSSSAEFVNNLKNAKAYCSFLRDEFPEWKIKGEHFADLEYKIHLSKKDVQLGCSKRDINHPLGGTFSFEHPPFSNILDNRAEVVLDNEGLVLDSASPEEKERGCLTLVFIVESTEPFSCPFPGQPWERKWSTRQPVKEGDKGNIRGNIEKRPSILEDDAITPFGSPAEAIEAINCFTPLDEVIQRLPEGIFAPNAHPSPLLKGAGYAVGDTFDIVQAGGKGATGKVLEVTTGGAVVAVEILRRGTGYASGVATTTSNTSGKGDNGLTLTVVADDLKDLRAYLKKSLAKRNTEWSPVDKGGNDERFGFLRDFCLHDLYVEGGEDCKSVMGSNGWKVHHVQALYSLVAKRIRRSQLLQLPRELLLSEEFKADVKEWKPRANVVEILKKFSKEARGVALTSSEFTASEITSLREVFDKAENPSFRLRCTRELNLGRGVATTVPCTSAGKQSIAIDCNGRRYDAFTRNGFVFDEHVVIGHEDHLSEGGLWYDDGLVTEVVPGTVAVKIHTSSSSAIGGHRIDYGPNTAELHYALTEDDLYSGALKLSIMNERDNDLIELCVEPTGDIFGLGTMEFTLRDCGQLRSDGRDRKYLKVIINTSGPSREQVCTQFSFKSRRGGLSSTEL